LKVLSEPILHSPISLAFQILGPASRTVKRLTSSHPFYKELEVDLSAIIIFPVFIYHLVE